MADALMANESVLRIIYERTNMLARFSSSRLVKATSVYNKNIGSKETEHKKARIDFDRKAWNKYEIQHNRLFKTYRDNVKGKDLDRSYEDLLRDGFDPVLDFLGVEKMELTAQKKQLHSSSILERLTDESQIEVKALLDEIGHPDWTHENKSLGVIDAPRPDR